MKLPLVFVRVLLFCGALSLIACKETIVDPTPKDPEPIDTSFFWNGQMSPVTFDVFDSLTKTSLTHTLTFSPTAQGFTIHDKTPATNTDLRASAEGGYVLLGGMDGNSFLRVSGESFVMTADTIAYLLDTMKIVSIITTPDGDIIAGMQKGGLYHYSRSTKEWDYIALKEETAIRALACDSVAYPNTSIFAATSNGIIRIVNEQPKTINANLKNVTRLALGINGYLYAASIKSISYCNTDNPLIWKELQSSTSKDYITSLTVLGEGRTIVYSASGSNKGLFTAVEKQVGSGTFAEQFKELENDVFATTRGASQSEVYAVSASSIYRSSNGGVAWNQIGTITPVSNSISSLAYIPEPARLYIATEHEAMYVRTNNSGVQTIEYPGTATNALIVTNDGKLIAANPLGFYEGSSDNEGKVTWATFTTSDKEKLYYRTPGSFYVLKTGLKVGEYWKAGTYAISTADEKKFIPYPLTARVTAHYDEVTTTNDTKPETYTYKDVYAVRYANETSPNVINDSLNYWTIYFAKDKGPVILEEFTKTRLTSRAYRTK